MGGGTKASGNPRHSAVREHESNWGQGSLQSAWQGPSLTSHHWWGKMGLYALGWSKAQVISQHAPGNLIYTSVALTWKSHPGAESFTPCWSRAEAQQKGDGYRLDPGWQQILSAMEEQRHPWQYARLPGSQPCCCPAKWTWFLGFGFPSIE